MYRSLIIISFLLINFTTAFGQNQWKLKTEKDGIKVYTSPVLNSKVKAVRVECTFQATLSQFIAVILDVKGCVDWVYHTRSCELVKQISPAELYYYSEINLPWPVENRDFVAHLTVTQNPHTKAVTIDGPAVAGFVPVKKDIVRINGSKGKWVVEPVGNEVKVEYTLQIDPGGAIPAWLVNMFAAEGPLQSFQKLKLQLKKSQYRNVRLSFIQD